MAAPKHYDQNVSLMENTSWFYNWVLTAWNLQQFPKAVAVCDVGCGTGALLAKLQLEGYTNLYGADFAGRCVAASQQRVPEADVFLHDIEHGPLPRCFDVIACTTVIDFIAQPVVALNNIRRSLKPGGKLVLTIRNRWAYWPWYHLRHLAAVFPNPRWRHWFLWFTTPLGLRRNDQPYEKVFSTMEARKLIVTAGLRPSAEYGFQWLPMLWIPEFPHWVRFLHHFDNWSRAFPLRARCYYYVFVCECNTVRR
jgi:SAM-dependent methyltransferase